MDVIYADKISLTEASTENGSFPATNLDDNHPKKVWKSTGASATEIITLTVASGAGAAALHAIQGATTVTVVISDGVGMDFGSVGGTAVLDKGSVASVDVVDLPTTTSDPQTDIFDTDPDSVGALWVEYDSVRNNIHRVDITLTAATAGVIQAGVVRAGVINKFVDPLQEGMRAGLRSYSIVEELNNGAKYISKKDIVRTFSFTLFENRDTDFYAFMRTVIQRLGEVPTSWRIYSGAEDWQFVVFAMVDGMPTGTHVSPDDSLIQVNLLEVI